MTEQSPGDLPADVPPEYAEEYRRGFERGVRGEPAEPPEAPPPPPPRPATRPVRQPARRAVYGAPRGYLDPDSDERPGWVLVLLLSAVGGVLVVGAFGLAQLFSTTADVGPGSAADPTPSAAEPSTGAEPWAGVVNPVSIVRASAPCEYPPGRDTLGHRVSYDAAMVADGDYATAWRCPGSGVGQRVTLTLPTTVRLAEVGMVPGYAKTDPASGEDRYAQNNRITRVRWTFDDGSSVVQRLDGSGSNRSMQLQRIPVVRTRTVVLEPLAVRRGPRDTVAVSEVQLSAAL